MQALRETVRVHMIYAAAVLGTIVVLILVLVSQTLHVQAQVASAPTTRQDNFREVIHGVEIVDPYRWLEDQTSPETRKWIDSQNNYTHSTLDGLRSRPFIQKRLTELMRTDSVGMPLERSGRLLDRSLQAFNGVRKIDQPAQRSQPEDVECSSRLETLLAGELSALAVVNQNHVGMNRHCQRDRCSLARPQAPDWGIVARSDGHHLNPGGKGRGPLLKSLGRARIPDLVLHGFWDENGSEKLWQEFNMANGK